MICHNKSHERVYLEINVIAIQYNLSLYEITKNLSTNATYPINCNRLLQYHFLSINNFQEKSILCLHINAGIIPQVSSRDI